MRARVQASSHDRMRKFAVAVTLSFLDVVAFFSGAAWVYIAVIAVAQPHELNVHVVDGIPLRRDTFGLLAFVVSGIAYFACTYLAPLVDHMGRLRREEP